MVVSIGDVADYHYLQYVSVDFTVLFQENGVINPNL